MSENTQLIAGAQEMYLSPLSSLPQVKWYEIPRGQVVA